MSRGEAVDVATIHLPHGRAGHIGPARTRDAPPRGRPAAPAVPSERETAAGTRRSGWRRALHVVRGVLGALFAADLVTPEPEPAEVRSLLIELGYLDAAAPPTERRPALAAFQSANGLPADGVATGRTVSALAREVRERRELRDLGLPEV